MLLDIIPAKVGHRVRHGQSLLLISLEQSVQQRAGLCGVLPIFAHAVAHLLRRCAEQMPQCIMGALGQLPQHYHANTVRSPAALPATPPGPPGCAGSARKRHTAGTPPPAASAVTTG